MPVDMKETLISLKQYLEVDSSGLVQSTLDSYRSALAATGAFGLEACPSLGSEFQEQLFNLQKSLEAQATPQLVTETHQQFETELKRASAHASDHLKRTAAELKELIVVWRAPANRWVNATIAIPPASRISARGCTPWRSSTT